MGWGRYTKGGGFGDIFIRWEGQSKDTLLKSPVLVANKAVCAIDSKLYDRAHAFGSVIIRIVPIPMTCTMSAKQSIVAVAKDSPRPKLHHP